MKPYDQSWKERHIFQHLKNGLKQPGKRLMLARGYGMPMCISPNRIIA
jgi:hypothetical protein